MQNVRLYQYHAACIVLPFLLVDFRSLVLIHHYYKVGGTAKRITICQEYFSNDCFITNKIGVLNCQWEFHGIFFCVIICHAYGPII